MENYVENYKKYNKILFKYMGYEEETNYEYFVPHNYVIGTNILMLAIQKINHSLRNENKMRVIISIKDNETEVFVQEWYDLSKKAGHINIVHIKEMCEFKKGECSEEYYREDVLKTMHRAIYNACVDFVIKAT
jgi:hypothetical protein